MPTPDPATPWWRRWWRRRAPSTARTRIICWVLLLVLGALAVLTLVTWRLLVQATDARMDEALDFEVREFRELTTSGVSPRTGRPFTTVDEVIGEAIAYNLVRPNEKFLGYVDGAYRTQSRQEPGTPEVLAADPAFAALVAAVSEPVRGIYHHPAAGEVRYLAIPLTLLAKALLIDANPGHRWLNALIADRPPKQT